MIVMMKTADILNKLGIRELNLMQQEAYHEISGSAKDVVVLSPTGSGKTLAYMLPVVELMDMDIHSVQVVVIVPGRELALQSGDVFCRMGTGLSSVCCYGGRPAMDEHRLMKRVCPQIVFGTPGRLNDHIDKGNINPYNVRYVVIDEFDKCLEMGFHDEMSRLLKKIPGVKRRFLLSATDSDKIPGFVCLRNSVRLDYTSGSRQVPSKVTLYTVRSQDRDKLSALYGLLCSLGSQSSIVFLNYRDGVERTADYLRKHGFYISAFHGGMEQRQREDALYKFSNKSANVFVSTNLASRGLDIPEVDNVIHYHLPLNEEEYVHRVGRTARWDSSGKSFFILGPDEHMPEFIDAECENYIVPVDIPEPSQSLMATVYIGKGKKDKISKVDIVGFLCKKAGLAPSEIGRIDVKDRYAYVAVSRPKLSQVLARTRGEKIKGVKTVVEFVK